LLQFTKLRLAGFKSFVEPTELTVGPGLTGIVGPNGCGKSNLVEALRWTMGESSAKQMRGGEMDDIIFGGTADRPARNVAEVIVGLDNSERSAPAAFNDSEELSVSRRIERAKGSTYRVNGKEMRARDVQLLFADAATGARSAGLVSQGRIGAVIAAKPTERRTILEEAAGITGLHSRRHEAELRLRGADTNLERLDDVLATLEAQRLSLKKQARQASRYRNLSGHIRRAEATLFHLRWQAAVHDLDTCRERLRTVEARVAELTRRAGAAAAQQAERAAGLPELRQGEAEAAAELQRLLLARDALADEEQRLEAARQACENRLQQVAADSERERALAADAELALQTLSEEQAGIERARQGEEEARETAARALAAARDAVDAVDARLTELTERVANDEARRASLAATLADLDERRRQLSARAADITRQRATLEGEAIDAASLESAETALATAREALESTRARIVAAEADRQRATDDADAAAETLRTAEAALARLEAEEQALAEILNTGDGETLAAVIDDVTVSPGYEAALGAALGDDLSAPADETAPVRWHTLPPLSTAPSLPQGAEPLARFVEAPPALARRLAQIGVVADEAQGTRLTEGLVQGQRLVSRDGALWRWDGYAVSADAATAATTRLEQRNRLTDLRARLGDARAEVDEATTKATAARAAADEAAAADRTARADLNDADTAYTRQRDTDAEIKERARQHAARLAALAENGESIERDLSAAEERYRETETALAALPQSAAARDEIATLRGELNECRAVQSDRQSAHDQVIRAAEERRRRLDDIARELASWRERSDGAAGRLGQLEERRQAVTVELESLSTRPKEIMEQRNVLLTKIEGAEQRRTVAADRLAESEARLAAAERDLRAAESELAQARESRVRIEGAVEQGEQACDALGDRIAERLETTPDQLAAVAELADGADLPELEAVERRVERLLRERETMGPVNLRAEQESIELNEQIESLETERADLEAAIEKLRRAIAELNREGRERLMSSFKEVDQNFQTLFVRMFGGGRAHLALTESDDPLEAGLEIMASPPGKRLQVLSLLSGGEQALTALALLFAVFLTNPAPICVLDEVDAPLDDANVDRFCTLLDDMAASGLTRFLVITHHRLTMARMHRLYGVTMAERGVSQLVSVDLQEAEEMRATA
jgi:chromosome segregation protein